MEYPLRHLSVRVPWHDSGWTGTICAHPDLNGACTELKRIAHNKNEADELSNYGKSLDKVSEDQWPPCVQERATFMSDKSRQHIIRHALAERKATGYSHFRPTSQRYPAYSAGIVPFSWMMRDNLDEFRKLYDIDVDMGREPKLEYTTTWIHEVNNQRNMLEAFSGHLREGESLVLFYAKSVPFVESTGRILIGAGHIRNIGELMEYEIEGDGPRGMVWERPIQHSIRPKGKEGFLMPFDALQKCIDEDPTVNAEEYIAYVPDEHWYEYSYASELVTHDGAIAGLLSIDSVLERMESDLGISTKVERDWVAKELIRLWKVRGPFPGLGAVLTAMGLSRGIFIAHAIQSIAGENTDPWPLVDKAYRNPGEILPTELHRDIIEISPTWIKLPAERKNYLKLLSRFEITAEKAKLFYSQASRRKRGWECSDKDLIKDPYILFNISRHDPEGIGLLAIDRGIFPDDIIRNKHPLDPPTALNSALDLRRIKSYIIQALEYASDVGHTVLAIDALMDALERIPAQPECPITEDILTTRGADLSSDVHYLATEGAEQFQLARYKQIGDGVRKQINGRIGGKQHEVNVEWKSVVDNKFKDITDPEETRAREEKVAALNVMAKSRFSVLAGPAGTGKTTLLGLLCDQPSIYQENILLLAPTGKARVRMQELAGAGRIKAFTIAQFLNRNNRYNVVTGRYHLSDHPKVTEFGTVIIDEASMLTEDMLGAILDALQGVKRYVFVGDPAQLPPIGAGRPFLDIIMKVRPENYHAIFPRVGNGYAELTIERRQIGEDRTDLRLARWFSHGTPEPADDDIFFEDESSDGYIRFVEWNKLEEFQEQLHKLLAEELNLDSVGDLRKFNLSLGATHSNGYDYFNRTRNGESGSVSQVEAWQILSPLHRQVFGVKDVNRLIHNKYRENFVELANKRPRSIPKPFGAEQLVYGDKVINLNNHPVKEWKVYPKDDAMNYLANGEIGIAVGRWDTGKYPKQLKIEFTSQIGYTYDFLESDFREEGTPALELAYALTIHKSQGSQFNLVILVLPEEHPILSRELLYTAITRHRNRVVVMHQGPRIGLKRFSLPHYSETARRRTNLMQTCDMEEYPLPKGSVFLQKGLIHRTSTRQAVRSKSEVIIADALAHAGISFEYEKALTLGGKTRYPDFTIEDDISGRTIIWEHLGMLQRDDYRKAWEKKLDWYRNNGVIPHDEEGEGDIGTLVITRDKDDGSIDSGKIAELIRTVLNA